MADDSENASGETAKGMEDVRERLYSIRNMEGIEILEGLELAEWQLQDVGVYDENENLIGIITVDHPNYLMS